MRDNRSLLARVLNPGVPWWIALPCNVIARAALVLLLIDPDGNLAIALALLGPAAVGLYGTAMFVYLRDQHT